MSLVDESELYNQISQQYDAIESLPIASLYRNQVEHALGPSCKDKTVLDLGGGTGIHARIAIDRGAAFVDNVDVSPGMLELGAAVDRVQDRAQDRIRWLEGDISKPLDHLPLQKEGYDIVMVNWTFDHAESLEQLEGMWANVAKYTKSGGQLISVRMSNPYAKTEGRYGVTLAEQEAIPGGCRYLYICHTDPGFSANATTMEASWDFEQSKTMAERYGFTDFTRVPEAEMEVIQKNRQFWSLHLEDPSFICITARKA